MSDADKPKAGRVGWIDLTVEDAAKIKSFYEDVVGWESSGVDMGGYEDFTMMPAGTGEPVAGVCHGRGSNAGLPAQWLIYITVDDLQRSIERCNELGGRVVFGPNPLAGGNFCVIEDPAGAVAALYQRD